MVYLDYAATTPTDPRVAAAMQPFFHERFGNPSSVHSYGQQAETAVEAARERVASILHCSAQEIVFTSCGSEADNLALRGVAMALKGQRGANRILTTRAEHNAVSKTAQQLEAHYGFRVTWLSIDAAGMVEPASVESALDEDVALVSVMYANNEIGTLNPIGEISAICHEHGVPFHTDAVQAGAYLPIGVDALGVDLMALGGHKLHAPKGVGALYVRSGTPLLSHLTGGGQESGHRAGTQNVPYIVGFATALELATQEREDRTQHVLPLRDRIIRTVLETIPGSRLSGHPESRLPNHASFAFKDTDGNLLLMLLDAAGFACSSGSACKTGSPEPSEVLRAIGLADAWCLGSLRVTVGKETTGTDVDRFLELLPVLVEQARGLKPGALRTAD
jgi:cysteine desulfurase